MSIILVYRWILWLMYLWYFYCYYDGYEHVLWKCLCMDLIMFLIVNDWIMYIWPNGWNYNECVEASMLHNDSQMSMRPICLDLLFTPVDYILVICLMKCLSWLVGVQTIPCSSNFICIIIPFLSFCSEGIIKLCAMSWPLGLKKWLKYQGRWHNNEKNSPWMLAYHVVEASRAFWMQACPYHGSVQGLIGLKTQWDSRAGYLRGWDGSWESCC